MKSGHRVRGLRTGGIQLEGKRIRTTDTAVKQLCPAADPATFFHRRLNTQERNVYLEQIESRTFPNGKGCSASTAICFTE